MFTAFLPASCLLRRRPPATTGSLLGSPDWQIKIFRDPAELLAAWPAAVRPDDFWLRRETLTFLNGTPQGIQTEAVVVEHADGRRLLFTLQTFAFSAAGQVTDAAKGRTSRYDFRRRLLSPFSFSILVVGQMLTSADYAQDGLAGFSSPEAADFVEDLGATLLEMYPGHSAILLKDNFRRSDTAVTALQHRGFYALPGDPVMGMRLPPEWASFEDYLGALTSKYRVRYRRARAKLEGITRRRLSAPEVRAYADTLYDLYRQTSSGADFNAAKLTANYFPWLAEAGRQDFAGSRVQGILEGSKGLDPLASPTTLTGYFDGDRLIGFTSAIRNGEVYHAHFLGLEPAYKFSHHLYHNMLFDLLGDAIASGARHLDYGRTALEIKSSVGAEPTEFAVLLKARSRVLNYLIPLFTPAVYTSPAWTQRRPFRK